MAKRTSSDIKNKNMNTYEENFQYTDFDGHFKDPILYDDVKLKRLSCSHIEQQTFVHQDGTKEKYCTACRTFESDMEVKS